MKRNAAIFRLLSVALLLAGCARSAPVSYYLLTAGHAIPPAAAATPTAPPLLGLGPVTLPAYLDRPQIVESLGPNRLSFADRHRWAEPLADNIAEVLRENLAATLGSDRVVLYPWNPTLAVAEQVTIEILHFETAPDNSTQFEARWSILDGEGKLLMSPRISSRHLAVAAPGGYAQQAAALSEALAQFSAEIIAALREVPAEKRPELSR